ncbi:nuclear transport factor 2 family protein [Mycobacterium sp. 1465703.0]|uniref:nuclear transport factor 2 family protein n=1 Tax=Mycobacterium sp. 1465703.0 TaxID=1834078 RepID=UPI0007FB9C51|nr:nuclear transport factor 2 family protein [Mycobacterium sp. 1465703.0]OBJ08848.1 hypothetical protein A5625_14175 [Mycobacterium sp. 1465703.0]
MTTIEEAEAAWIESLTEPTTERMRQLVHPEFIAVHGPTGQIQGAERFLADTAARPGPRHVQIVDSTVRVLGDTATVSCIEEYRAQFVPDAPPFVIQAAVSRVWIRQGGQWLLAHLQMARRVTPG